MAKITPVTRLQTWWSRQLQRWQHLRQSHQRHAPEERHARGRWGEAQALRWLRREHRFRLLARNWWHAKGELDLIGTIPAPEVQGRLLLFVEVRTHAAGALHPGPYSLSARKKEVMRRTANAYRWGPGKHYPHWRHDLVQVTVEVDGTGSCILFQNVW